MVRDRGRERGLHTGSGAASEEPDHGGALGVGGGLPERRRAKHGCDVKIRVVRVEVVEGFSRALSVCGRN